MKRKPHPPNGIVIAMKTNGRHCVPHAYPHLPRLQRDRKAATLADAIPVRTGLGRVRQRHRCAPCQTRTAPQCARRCPTIRARLRYQQPRLTRRGALARDVEALQARVNLEAEKEAARTCARATIRRCASTIQPDHARPPQSDHPPPPAGAKPELGTALDPQP
jgi:hypothetical protein